MLATVAPFSELDDSVRARIAATMTVDEFGAGEVFAADDDLAHQIFVILDGEAEVVADGRVVRTLGAHDVVGEIGVLVTGRRTATVRAVTGVRVAVLSADDVARLAGELPALHRSWLHAAGERLRPPPRER